jgi:hypothetical protein
MIARMAAVARSLVVAVCGLALTGCGPAPQNQGPSPSPSGVPATVVLDGTALMTLRGRLRSGDSLLGAALTRLVDSADKQLEVGPLSVMDKAQVPPSGDRHDYYSQSIYAWPNPKTADGLPWVTRDGERNPAADTFGDAHEWTALVNATHALALAWFYTGDGRYATRAATLLRAWFVTPATRMNPNLAYAQRTPGVARSAPGGIIDLADIGVVVDAAALVEGSSAWTRADARGFQDWLGQYLDWLLASPEGRSEAAATNNHSSWYDAQTAAIAVFTGRRDEARHALMEGRAHVASQIRPDGSQPLELARATSWSYSVYNLRALSRLAAIGRAVDAGLWTYTAPGGASLRLAVDYLVPAAAGARPWTAGKQVTAFDPTEALPVLHAAADAGDATARDAIDRVPAGGTAGDRWLLAPAA